MGPAASIWKRASMVLVVLLLTWLLFAWCFDYASVDDSDLAFVERAVDPSRNPYPEIRELEWTEEEKEEFSRVSRMLGGREPIDIAFLEGMLQKHAPVLERFSRYAAMDDWRMDEVAAGREPGSDYMMDWRTLAPLIRVKAASLAARGETRAALERAVSMLDFAAAHTRVRESSVLIARFFTSDGGKCLLGLLEHHRMDRETLAWLAGRLEGPNLSRDDLEPVLRSIYPRGKANLVEFEEASKTGQLANWRGYRRNYEMPKSLHSLAFKRYRTHAMLADIHRAAIQASGGSAKEVGDSVYAAVPRDARARWGHRLSGNSHGVEFAAYWQRILVNVVVKLCRANQADLHLLRLRVALERHRLDHGAWPDDLGELVPAYLDDLPPDPFDGRPLRYDRAKRVVYSIGPDLGDNRGVPLKDLFGSNETGDIVIELEPGKPTPWPEFPQP